MEKNFLSEAKFSMEQIQKIQAEAKAVGGGPLVEKMAIALEFAYLDAAVTSFLFFIFDVDEDHFERACKQRQRYKGLWAIK